MALVFGLLLLGPPAIEEMVGNPQISGYLCNRSCRVSDQPHGFSLKLFRILPSGLGAHTVLRFHPVPPYTGVCEIGGRSTPDQAEVAALEALQAEIDFRGAID